MAKIKRNDQVVVIAGKDKGKQGRVLRVISDKNRVLVEGVGIVTKHKKPNPQTGQLRAASSSSFHRRSTSRMCRWWMLTARRPAWATRWRAR